MARRLPREPNAISDDTTRDACPMNWYDDRADIVDLATRYTWALDTKHVDELDDVFLAESTATLHGVSCWSRDEIKARIGGAILGLDATQHLIGNHQIEVDGDTATHRCQLHGQHVRAGCEGGDTYVIGGFYQDRLVRSPDGWRIEHRLMQQTWASGNPGVVRR
jgi:hypothetical protein